MTLEDSDDEDDEWDPDIRVFDPVKSDDDSVLDALQRDLEGDVGPGSKFENDVSPSLQCPERFQHVGQHSCFGCRFLGTKIIRRLQTVSGTCQLRQRWEVQCGW